MIINKFTPHNFIAFCYHRHDVICNQKYDDTLPYSFHLECVVKNVEKFIHLIDGEHIGVGLINERDWVKMAAAGHDLMEDARMTYNDIKDMVGSYIANIIYCCTEEKGRNREERHSEKYIHLLCSNKLAVFVKLCDIAANVKYSLLTNSSMFDKYRDEFPVFKTKVSPYHLEYRELFDYIDKLLAI